MKKIIFILAGFIFLAAVFVFVLSDRNKSQIPEEQEPVRKDPIVLDIGKDNSAFENTEAEGAGSPDVNQETPGYKILNLSSSLSVMLMSSSKSTEYFPDDYRIGDIISFVPSSLKKAVNMINTLLASMSLGEYPDDLFHPQTRFYLEEKLKSGIDRQNAPLWTRIGWPLTETDHQLNIPVKFVRRKESAAGEVIFEKSGENLFIIDIAVDFTELTHSDSEAIIYDDLKFY